MKVFLVKTSTGEWEDTSERIDSVWTNEEDAKKRITILENDNQFHEKQKCFCWNCPCNNYDSSHTLEECLKMSQEYCKKFCSEKGKPRIEEESSSIECDESSSNYESVTVYSPEACDLDNAELLKDGSISSN